MIEHKSPISGVATFEHLVATAGYDNQVILWDLGSGQALARGLHDHLANQCAFKPDGKCLVTSSSDYTARVWSVPDLRLQAVLRDHEDDVEMAVFHPREDLIATVSRDHKVRVFDASGQLIHRFAGHDADALSVEWVDNGTELITSGDDGSIRRWSLHSGKEIGRFDLNGVETDTVVVFPSGDIYAGTDDGEIVIIRGNARRVISGHAAGIKRLIYSPRVKLLVSLSYDRTMKIWRCTESGIELLDEAAMPPDVWARSCAFAEGNRLIVGTFGSTFRTYDYSTRRWTDAAGPTSGVNAVAIVDGETYSIGDAGIFWHNGSPVRQLGSLCNFLLPIHGRVLTGGQLGLLFDALAGTQIYQHRSPLNCGAAYELGAERRAIIGSYTGEGLVFAVSDSGVELVSVIPCHANAIKGVAVSDGTMFSVCADRSCAWHDAATLAEIHRIPQAHDKIANGCAALPGGRFASVSRDRKLRIWIGFEAEEYAAPHINSIKCVASDRQGKFIASGSYGGHVAIFGMDVKDWVMFQRISASGVSCLCYDDLRECFVASCYDGSIVPIHFPHHG